MSDRIELTVESNEPILEILVSEGQQLQPGQVVMVQDANRVALKIQRAQASIRRIEALLLEQQNGPRPEIIAAAQAAFDEAQLNVQFRQRDLDRVSGLRERNLTSVENYDLASRQQEAARQALEIARAGLQDLLSGTRIEQIDQTRYQLQQAQAELALLELEQQRLSLTAPLEAVVDSLPFEVGERPAVGDVVAILLTGTQPHARIYIPETHRTLYAPGDRIDVRADGVENVLAGTIRWIASESTFTPYFALTERDRGRLSYVAEVALPATASRLPEGLPVVVDLQDLNDE